MRAFGLISVILNIISVSIFEIGLLIIADGKFLVARNVKRLAGYYMPQDDTLTRESKESIHLG